MANKFTPSVERAARAEISATWNGTNTPTSVSVSSQFTRKLINDDDANNVIELQNGTVSFDGLRTDRSVQVGAGPTLTYRQVSLYLLQMIADARANP